VIDGAESMTPEAHNALLKLLEEPPDKVVIVMTTADEGSVPETIRSRCQILRLRPLAFDRVEEALVAEGVDRSTVADIAHMSAGRIGLARAMVDDNSLVEERTEAFENLVELVGMETDERLRLAGRMAEGFYRDRETLLKRLGLWEALWRDILLQESGISEARPDTEGEDASLVGVGVARARRGVGSVQSAIHALQRNGNPRLVMESLVLAAPSSPRH
jgi:DNA polymerase-3 subunit delta'